MNLDRLIELASLLRDSHGGKALVFIEPGVHRDACHVGALEVQRRYYNDGSDSVVVEIVS